MAVTTKASERPAPADVPAPPAGSTSPRANPSASGSRDPLEWGPWLLALYLGGLILVFGGERIFASNDTARYAMSGLGVVAVLGSTVTRLVGALRVAGERRRAELALARYSLGGLLGLALYFATSTETGRNLVGITKASAEMRARIDGVSTIAWVVLILVSVLPLLFGERALYPMRRAERLEHRRVHAAIVAGMTLSLAAIYAALFTYAAGELDIKADFSYFRTARPGESTRNMAKSLTEPVKVIAFFPQLNDVGGEVEGYLRDLASSAPQLQVERQDRLLVPTIAKENKVSQDGVVVLTRGTSRETLTVGADMKSAQAKLKTLDADFQKVFLKVLRSQKTAYLTTGHGEMNQAGDSPEGRTTKLFKKLLEMQNFGIKDLGLAQGLANDVPPDASIVIVLGPTQAFQPEEIESLRRYAERGGKLLLALDPEPKIDFGPLAATVDVTWKPIQLGADKNYIPRRRNPSDHGNLISNVYSSHASVSTVSRARAPVIFFGASSLEKAQGSTAKVDFAVRSLTEAFADDNGNFEFDQGAEKRSSYNLAAAVTRPATGGEGDKDENEMRAFVFADADVLSDALLGGHEPEAYMALDVVRWLAGEESFSGAVTSTEDVRIEHTKQKDQLWFYAIIFGAPLLVVGAGVFLTRRKPKAMRRLEVERQPA